MIWLIGNKGMLGADCELDLKENDIGYFASDKEIDITKFDEIEDFTRDKGISWIINCSAYTNVDGAEEETDLAFGINDKGVLNIAKIAQQKNARLIHLSTDYVFDGKKDGEYFEDDEPNPISVYGKSKLEGERNIIITMKDFFIIRISWLYGKNGKNFVYTMLNLFKTRDEIRVVSDQYGSPTFTKDVSALITEIILNDSKGYGIYHYTNEGKITWFDFAREIYRILNEISPLKQKVNIIPLSTNEFPAKAKRPKNSYMSKEKIKDALNIKIPNWQESLKIFLDDICKE